MKLQQNMTLSATPFDELGDALRGSEQFRYIAREL
jgi:hypothetical protein